MLSVIARTLTPVLFTLTKTYVETLTKLRQCSRLSHSNSTYCGSDVEANIDWRVHILRLSRVQVEKKTKRTFRRTTTSQVTSYSHSDTKRCVAPVLLCWVDWVHCSGEAVLSRHVFMSFIHGRRQAPLPPKTWKRNYSYDCTPAKILALSIVSILYPTCRN